MMSKKVLDHCPFPALPIPYGCYCGLTLTTPTKGKVSWSKGILGGKGVSHFVSLKVFWEENGQENSNFVSISCSFHSVWLLLTQASLIKGKFSSRTIQTRSELYRLSLGSIITLTFSVLCNLDLFTADQLSVSLRKKFIPP